MSFTQNILVYHLLLLCYLVVFFVVFLTNTTPQESIASGPDRPNDRRGYKKSPRYFSTNAFNPKRVATP